MAGVLGATTVQRQVLEGIGPNESMPKRGTNSEKPDMDLGASDFGISGNPVVKSILRAPELPLTQQKNLSTTPASPSSGGRLRDLIPSLF